MKEKEYKHTPVLLKEVLEYLRPKPRDNFIDGTLGGGGYTLAIAKAVGPCGKVLAIDLDCSALDHAKALIKEHGPSNILLAHGNFADLKNITAEYLPKKKFQGIVLDLGLSSEQLRDSERGFSFQTDGPLNMAFDSSGKFVYAKAVEKMLNNMPAVKLAEVIRKYGEERYANRIAESIVRMAKEKPLERTFELVSAISRAVPAEYRRGKIHFATKTFQALRISTNKELENLEKFLPQAVELLERGGRLAIVSFHSLEDRIVKNFFRQESRDCVCPPKAPVCNCGHKAILKIITKKVVVAGDEEIEGNPRARSAKMRVVEKTA